MFGRAKRNSVAWAVAALVLVLSAAPSVAAQDLPPITAEPTGATLAGKVVWYELITDDVDGARTFYGTLFGWRFDTIGSGPIYTLITAQGRRIGGIVARDESHAGLPRSIWIPVISVSDVDGTAARIAAAGGTVLQQPSDSGSRGRHALVQDARGAPFALLASATGDPRDDPIVAGQWTAPSLLTRNPAPAMGFYTSVFGYQEGDAEDQTGFGYRVLKQRGRVQAFVVESHMIMNRVYPAMGPADNWVPLVHVKIDGSATEERRAVVDRARNLGARVLTVRPTEVLILDPRGAAVGLDFLDPATWD